MTISERNRQPEADQVASYKNLVFLFLDSTMSRECISKVLLVSFDDTQLHTIQKLRGIIERDQCIMVYNLNDIQHEYKKEPSYATKLNLLLDCVKFSILVTSHKLSDIQETDDLLRLFQNMGLDDEASKIFLAFFNIEMTKKTDETKLLFLSLEDDIELPGIFSEVNHIKNIFGKDCEASSYVNESQMLEIVAMCRRTSRRTFPVKGNEKLKTNNKYKKSIRFGFIC